VSTCTAEGVLPTGFYGSGKSSVAQEIAYLVEQQGQPYTLLDLDYLSWAGTGTGDRAAEFGLMLRNLAAVAANYRKAGIRLFVLAYFVRSHSEVTGVREALGAALPSPAVRVVNGVSFFIGTLPRSACGYPYLELNAAAKRSLVAAQSRVRPLHRRPDRPDHRQPGLLERVNRGPNGG
jgi:hypothetical protein